MIEILPSQQFYFELPLGKLKKAALLTRSADPDKPVIEQALKQKLDELTFFLGLKNKGAINILEYYYLRLIKKLY